MSPPERPTKARSRARADRIRRFFEDVGGDPASDTAAVVVTHVLPDRPFFVEELTRVFDRVLLYAKPKSADARTLEKLRSSEMSVSVRMELRDAFDDGSVIPQIVDVDPVRQVQALSLGFPTIEKMQGLRQSDLIVGATGAKCLHDEDWYELKPGAIVFTVTSSDDELDLTVLEGSPPHRLTEQNSMMLPMFICTQLRGPTFSSSMKVTR